MKLRTKFLIAEAPLVCAVGLLGLYAVDVIGRVGGMAGTILEDNYRSVVAMQRIESATDAVDQAFLESFLARSDCAIPSSAVAVAETELALQERNLTETGEPDATKRLRAAFDAWRGAFDSVAKAPPEERYQLWLTRVRGRSLEIGRHADGIIDLNHDAMLRKSSETSRATDSLARTLSATSLFAVAVAGIAAFVLAERIVRPLVRLAESARRVGEGDLDVALDPATGKDEVATLVREFGAMTARLRTYRKSTIGELLEATEVAQAAIDSLSDPVLAFREDGTLQRANQAAGAIGVNLGESDPLARVAPELRTAIESERDRVIAGRPARPTRALEGAVPVLVGGTPRYLQVVATPIYGEPSGAVVGVTVLVRDVTQLRRADELKTDLLSTVAHELRTPLTSIRMGVHLCLERAAGPLTDKQEELLHVAREDAERLHRLIDGILSVARIEAGALVGRRRAVRCDELVEGAVAGYRVAAADRSITLAASLEPTLPHVSADPDSIVLVLGNLLSNAVKLVPAGGRIDVTALPQDGKVRFEVRDTGPGIAPEHLARVFEKFYRVPGSPPGGTGLGLAIARDVVYAHDGEIGVESEPGKGSTFWFTLPTA